MNAIIISEKKEKNNLNTLKFNGIVLALKKKLLKVSVRASCKLRFF